MPVLLWAFAALWCGGVVVGTALLWFEGLPEGATPLAAWGVLAVVWPVAIGLGAYAFSQPATTLRFWTDGRAQIVRQWPLARRVLALRAQDLRVQLHSGKDSEGEPYFWLKLSAGALQAPLTIVEGRREDCEAVRERLLAAGAAMAVEPDAGPESGAGA